MAKKQPGYGEAIEELEAIIEEIESESIDVDLLTEKVKRASYLIGLCKGKLRDTESEVRKVLEGLASEVQQEDEEDDPDDTEDEGGDDSLF